MASLIRLETKQHGPLLFFLQPASGKRVAKRMTIKVSNDEGMTWPEKWHTLVDERSTAYSCMTAVGENHVGLVYEAPGENSTSCATRSTSCWGQTEDAVVAWSHPAHASPACSNLALPPAAMRLPYNSTPCQKIGTPVNQLSPPRPLSPGVPISQSEPWDRIRRTISDRPCRRFVAPASARTASGRKSETQRSRCR